MNTRAPIDLRAIEDVWQQTRRSVKEYAHVPLTTHSIHGPCVTSGCLRIARTMHGRCPVCTRRTP